MDKIKVIKTEQDYQEALKLVEELIGRDPDPESTEGEQLSLLSTLIHDYESKAFPVTLPNPIDAIKFRMDQANLKPADLIPYLGSRSRVSEILSGKRQLTIEMVRALSEGLGIPAKVLIQETTQDPKSKYQRWDIRLVKLMEERGYFGKMSLKKFDRAELLKNLFSSVEAQMQPAALLRKTSYRSTLLTDKDILSAWIIRVLRKAKEVKTPTKYKPDTIDLSFIRNFVKLSTQERSPIVAQKQLKEIGIKLIIEPHLPKTYLDGAVIFTEKDSPVIGLTIRHDRLDNFWFTLAHELAHVGRHYGQNIEIFFDEKIQEENGIEYTAKDKEKEADEWAEEAILPKDKWEISPARITPSPMAAQSLANELGIDIAVVAGIVQFKHENFYYLHKIINDDSKKIRHLFPESFGKH